jgi:hypothetical protein
MSTLRRRVRDRLPASFVARVNRARLLASLQRERWGRGQRRINDSISVPNLPRARRQAGAVWGVCLARNEEDIVEHTIRHMLDQGLDGIIVVDNMSTDRTRALLDELAAADPRVHVGVDRQVGFHQGGKVSYLAHLAWRAGADWIVPFDADEFWFAEGESVGDFLRHLDAASAWCDFRNVFPTVEDGAIDFARRQSVQVERHASAWLRVCFRARRWAWVGEGNHALRDAVELPVRGLHMLHYSYRSLEQYSRKVDHGVAALEAAGKDASIATHWRLWASIPPAQRETLWRRYLSGDGVAADDPVVSVERVVIDDPTHWKTWNPEGEFS